MVAQNCKIEEVPLGLDLGRRLVYVLQNIEKYRG